MDSEPSRSRNARQRAQDVLVEIALAAGPHTADFVVIGGLNPDFLTPGAPVPHLGTTDVDLLIELGMIFDRDELDFGWIDGVLAQARSNATGWQWRARRDPGIAIEFLCDEADSPGLPIELPGAAAKAFNVRGAAPARFDPITRSLPVPEHLRGEGASSVSLKFAGLGGYLLAKTAAYRSRSADKDGYDFAYVALHCEGGPRAAAGSMQRWLDSGFALSHAEAVRSTLAAFIEAPRPAAVAYASSMVEAGSIDEFEVLVEDAASAAQLIQRALSEGTVI